MLVTNDAAVFQASAGLTFGIPRLSHRCDCTRWNRYRNSTDTAANASTDRAYTPQVCSASGLTPTSR